MSLNSAINKAPGLYITKKLHDAKDNDHADAAALLKILKAYQTRVFLLHLFVAVISLGLVPLIYFLGKRHANKTLPANKQDHTNFFTYAFYESAEAISAFEDIINGEAPENSEEGSQNTSQYLEENNDSQDESSSSESSKSDENDEDRLYRFAVECNHPLGPRVGGRILTEDPLHKNLNTEYGERMSATILNNGDILACDVNLYQGGGEDRAIGIFDHGKKLLKPLFRFMQSSIENNMVALEYKPNKFVFFYRHFGKNALCFNEGRHQITQLGYSSSLVIPLQFEFTKVRFDVSEILLRSGLDGINNMVACRRDYISSTNKDYPLDFQTVSTHLAKTNSDDRYEIKSRLYDPIVYKDDPTQISAMAYNPSSTFFYIANEKNKLYRVPVKQMGNHVPMISRNGDPQGAQIEEGKPVTKIAVSKDEKYIVIAREDGHFEVYKMDADFNLSLLSSSVIDPTTEGDILDIKFVEDKVIFATSKKTLTINVQQIKDHDKDDKKDTPSKKELEALRKHHSANGSTEETYDVAQTERVRSTILSNGNIVACDKSVFKDGTGYTIKVLHGKYKFSYDVKPIIIDMKKKKRPYLHTSNPIATQFIPYHKNDRLIYVVRDKDLLKVLDADLKVIATLSSPVDESHLLMPIDFDTLGDPQKVSVVEFCKNGVLFHSITCGTHNGFRVGTHVQNTARVIKAATYNSKNQRLYCIDGEQFKFINLVNGENPNQDYFDTRDKRLIGVTHMTVSDNGNYLATTKADGTITLYDIEEFNRDSKGEIKHLHDFKIEGAEPLDIRFVDNDTDLLITTNKQPVRVYDFEEDFAHKTSIDLR